MSAIMSKVRRFGQEGLYPTETSVRVHRLVNGIEVLIDQFEFPAKSVLEIHRLQGILWRYDDTLTSASAGHWANWAISACSEVTRAGIAQRLQDAIDSVDRDTTLYVHIAVVEAD